MKATSRKPRPALHTLMWFMTSSRDSTSRTRSFYDGMDHKKYSSYGFGAGYNAMDYRKQIDADIQLETRRAVNLQAQTGFSVRRVEVACRRGARLVSGHRSARFIHRRSAERPLPGAVQQQWSASFSTITISAGIKMSALTALSSLSSVESPACDRWRSGRSLLARFHGPR